MNTPKPCSECRKCGWNCMTEDDPNDMAYCQEGLSMGDLACPGFDPDPAMGPSRPWTKEREDQIWTRFRGVQRIELRDTLDALQEIKRLRILNENLTRRLIEKEVGK